MPEVQINYKPRKWSKILHNSTNRWNVIVAHRRAGKTVASINHLIREAMRVPKSDYAYIAPTYKQAKAVVWNKILKEYSRPIPHCKINEAELYIQYPNGSRITLYGADNPDSLRGIGLWGVVFDEYSQQPSNIFSEVVSKCLAEHNGFAIWIGTPKGKNEFYKTYHNGLKQDNWTVIYQPVTKTIEEEEDIDKYVTNIKLAYEDDLELVKQGRMTLDEVEQEWNCSFVVSASGSYYGDIISQARTENRFTNVPWIKHLPVMTWWDLGMSDSTSIIFFQKVNQEWHVIDAYDNEGEGLQHYIDVLQKKGYIYGSHWAPHDIAVRELGTGLSRIEMAASMGLKFNIVPKKLSDQDRINALRSRFNTLWFDIDKCDKLLDALASYHKVWDEKRGEWKNKPEHDWSCFVGETNILTHNGMYQIMELDNHKILTPNGWKKMKPLGKTGINAQLVEVTFNDNTQVKCTPEHLFLTEKGWKSAEFLEKDLLIQSSLTLTRSILMVGYTAFGLMKSILQEVAESCTERFGRMHLEKFQKDATYTTKILMLRTIILKIWSALMHTSTYQTTGSEEIQKRKSIFQIMQEKKQQSGMLHQKECCGTKDMQKILRVGLNGNTKKKNVNGVRKSLKGLLDAMVTLKNTVTQIVEPLRIEKIRKIQERADVYDINVPVEHCFSLSNGAVVHNSHFTDAMNYWAVTPEFVNSKPMSYSYKAERF